MKILQTKSAIAGISVLLLMGCNATTSITGSYKNPEMNGKTLQYKKIFIAALTPNTAVKSEVESSLAESLTAQGYTAVKSIDIFMPGSQTETQSDIALQAIRETGSDAVLAVTLVNQENEMRYVPGNSYPVNTYYSHYGSFGGYWGSSYNMMYEPGYYTTDKTYFIETNLYDVASQKLIWSAQSQTLNPSDINDFMHGYKKSIRKQLVKDGLVSEDKK
jgi:nitrogen regulatory protein PII-like uncharacterized protein